MSTAYKQPSAKLPFYVALPLAVLAGYAILMFLPHHELPADSPLPQPQAWYEHVQRAVVTSMRIPAGALLFLCGLGLGWVQPRYWFLLGLATITILPVASVAELVAKHQSPPIWMMMEFAMFFCLSLPALAGAAIGRMIRYRGIPPGESVFF